MKEVYWKPTSRILAGISTMPARRHLILFFGIVLFLASWHLFGGTNDNATSRAAMVAAIVEHGTFRIDAYAEHAGDKALIKGHYYSEKAPLPALLVVPFWWALHHLLPSASLSNGTLDPRLVRLGGFLIGSVPFALIVTLVWVSLHRTSDHSRVPLAWAAALPFFGSFLFLQSGVFFGHLIGAAFLLLAYRAWERGHLMVCGALSGAAVLCEFTVGIFPVCWGLTLLIRRDYRALGKLALGALPACVLLAAYNMAISGSPFTIGYAHQVGYDYMHTAAGFGLPDIVHLWHITFSDYRGLFFFAPVLALALVALFARRDAPRWWLDPVILPGAVSILAISGFGGWWGGWSYGPRYLTAVAVLLLYRCLPSLIRWEWSRWTSAPAAVFGIICAFAAKDTVGFSLPTGVMHPLTEIILPALGRSASDAQWPILFGAPAWASSVLFVTLFITALFILRRMDGRVMSPPHDADGPHDPQT